MTAPKNKYAWLDSMLADERFTHGEARALTRIAVTSTHHQTLEFRVRQVRIAAGSCVGQATVSKAIAKAAEYGYLTAVCDSQSKRPRTTANTYRLALPASPESDPEDTQPYSPTNTVNPSTVFAQESTVFAGESTVLLADAVTSENVAPHIGLIEGIKCGTAADAAATPTGPPEPDEELPPRYCPDHMPNGTPDNCGACGRHRIHREETEQRRDEQRERARRDAIAACPHCDDRGLTELPNGSLMRCDHQTTPTLLEGLTA